jgi:hypothetical protein
MGGGMKIKRQKKMEKGKGKGKREVDGEEHWFGETECRF